MNKLWILLKVQILGLFGISKFLHSKDKKERSKFIRFFLLFIFVFFSLLYTIVMYDYAIISSLNSIGLPQLMPALMMAVASLITLVTTIYKANGLLIGFKDFDMTMAMPIKTSTVVASRLLLLYLMNAGFCLLITLPSGIIYSLFVPQSPLFFVYLTLLTLFVPLVPMLIGTALGLLISAVSSRFRHANVVNIILALILTLAGMSLSFAFPTIITNPQAFSKVLMNSVYRIYPLTGIYTRALCQTDTLSLLLFVFISIILFACFVFLIGKYFKYLNTVYTTTRARSNYRMKSLEVSSVIAALYKRELRRYFASIIYVLNTAFGMVMAVIMGVALLVFKPAQFETILEIPGFADIIVTLAPMVLVTFVCLSCTTSSSISLDGRSFWILKSLPVKAETIFLSKIMVNLTITLPLSLISSVLLSIALKMNFIQVVFMLLTPAVFAVLTAEVGLFLNLMYPNFSWTNETAVVKQSMPTLITTLGGMGVSVALLVGLTKLPQSFQLPGLVAITVIVAVADLILYRLLKTKGVIIFRKLQC
ncbi:MAG: hypothetical protein PHR24_07155 [Oscillospiraceae bacterium]|nr:hypothetical protein [Oscillospiraceae bacterium]MDD4547056.1 hypothetical protein [Oscillospiraceae bacterium]